MDEQKVTIEFVFGKKDPELTHKINHFWGQFRKSYTQEMNEHMQSTSISNQFNKSLKPGNVTSLKREPAAIAKDALGSILGIVFVTLTKVESTPSKNEYVYFQRMYTQDQKRHFRISNQLYTSFLTSFKEAINERDPRARYLMAENANPGLRRPSMRRYFFRLGFRMLGTNHLGYEIWRLPLKTIE